MSQHSDDDEQSRKRPWFAASQSADQLPGIQEEEEEVSPTKRTRKGGISGFFSNPFGFLNGMFYGGEKKKGKEKQEEEGEEVIVERVSPKKKEHSGQIIFLNEDNPRHIAGSDEIVIEKFVQKDVTVSEDEEEEDVQEIHTSKLETSFEIQQEEEVDDETEIIYEKVVKTPNRHLQEAREFEKELIFLNEDQEEDPEIQEEEIQDERNHDFMSPQPDDSVSRPRTPLHSPSIFNSSSSSVRDFWKRGSCSKKPTSSVLKKVTVKQSFKYTNQKKKNPMEMRKKEKTHNHLSQLNVYFQSIQQSGIYDMGAARDVINERKKQKKMTADLIAKAQNKISELKASRPNTPSGSRASSVIFDGASTSDFRRDPSSSSSSICEIGTPTTRKFNDIISQINNLQLNRRHDGPQRYEVAYAQTKDSEVVLREEARLRAEHRAQTKGDQYESTRKKLELQGVVIRPPKVEKKKIDDFMALPDAADRLLEKAWNRGLSENEQFVEAFNIPIQRKDLATLSGLHWLNDNVINYYLQMICDRSQKDAKYPKTYAFNTFFYTNIVTKGYASVKRWTRKVDIFSYEILLIPVHLGMHWCMAVIDMVEQKIEFYDSLYNGNTQVLPALKNYLVQESQDKKKQGFSFDGWTIRQLEDIPRQNNGSDCGVFSCQFGEWASRRTAPRFTHQNMPYYRKRMVYEIVTQKLLATL